MLDQVNLPKNLQFKLIYLLQKLPQCIPYYFFHPFKNHFALGCMKMVLQGSEFQQVLNIGSQNDYFQLSDGFMMDLQFTLNLNHNDIHILVKSPYEVLDEIQEDEMMTVNILRRVKCILDYALTLPETYFSSPHDLLYACMWTCCSYNNMVSFHLGWYEGPVSTNLVSLKQKIQSSIVENSTY